MAGVNTGALATLKEVADGFLLKSGLPESRAVQIKQILIDGYRELNLLVLDEGRIVELFEMDENLILQMPDDLIDLKDIYIPKGNTIWSLTRSKVIPIVTEIKYGAEVTPEDWGGGGDIPHDTGVGYQTKGGVNTGGYYTVDMAKRRIIFRNINRSQVMLDYNSSGISRKDVTYIPNVAKPALEAHIMMELSVFGILPINQYELHKKRYENQKGILRFMDFNFTAFTDAVYKTFNGSYRR